MTDCEAVASVCGAVIGTFFRMEGARACRVGARDGEGCGPVEELAGCCCCDAGCGVEVVDEGVLAAAAAPPADLLGTMEGLKRAPPFSIRDDMM